jgi:putative tricarboxylic transport membrane protein
MMRRRVFIEGLVLIIVGIVGMAEGVRLMITQGPGVVHDVVGPNRYLMGVAIALIITGAIHILHYRKGTTLEKLKIDMGMLKLAMKIFIILIINVFLIEMVGFFLATAVFFVLTFRVLGITSWLKNAILTIISSSLFYIIFVYLLNMAFPQGIVFS